MSLSAASRSCRACCIHIRARPGWGSAPRNSSSFSNLPLLHAKNEIHVRVFELYIISKLKKEQPVSSPGSCVSLTTLMALFEVLMPRRIKAGRSMRWSSCCPYRQQYDFITGERIWLFVIISIKLHVHVYMYAHVREVYTCRYTYMYMYVHAVYRYTYMYMYIYTLPSALSSSS